jgi:Domain of unknown function (DUF1963)
MLGLSSDNEREPITEVPETVVRINPESAESNVEGPLMLKQKSHRLHPEFDRDAACQTFGSSIREFGNGELRGELITSPFDLYSVEELRDHQILRIGKPHPTDVFVFCKGEPSRRDCTKVGGLPYWPTNKRWPVDQSGKPYRFLAQFNFADSVDLFPNLPGDVLLLLVREGDDWLCDEDQIHFEWLPLGLDPVATFDSAQIAHSAGSFFGAIHRTADYPDASDRASETVIEAHWNLPILNGTKIGGLPHFIQGDDVVKGSHEIVRSNPFNPRETIVIKARPARTGFLCQLGSIQAEPGVPYPWANQVEPLDLDDSIYSDKNSVVFDDMGSIYIFRDDAGEMWSCSQSY